MMSQSINKGCFTMEKQKAIAPSNLFYTPKDMEELTDILERYTGGEKQVAWVAAMMAWNLACSIINE
tara:strand:- start:380 stop:580 length:201 start_codon:yes stop_codon:yes gene_type:complete